MKSSNAPAPTPPAKRVKRLIRTLLLLSALYGASASAGVIATDPGDYVAFPAGTNLAVLYYNHAERNDVYLNDHKQDTPGFGLDNDIAAFRAVHYVELGPLLAAPQVIVPFGSLRMKGAADTSASGVGDPLIGSAFWLVNDPARRRYLSFGAWIAPPLGNYDADDGPVNIGENRWKGVLHTSYTQSLFGSLSGEVTAEWDFFGENDDFAGMTRKQSHIFELQTHLRYDFSPGSFVGASYFHTTGGENRLNGVDLDDSLNTKRYLLSVARMVAPTVQLMGQVGQDLEVRNGPKEDFRVNLRLVKIF
ncbi:transporter [Pseudomonas taiwanensis]|nr:transporter [Pseudomonas taiwanensis]